MTSRPSWQVLQQLKTLVHLLVRTYGQPKFAIGEMTPRKDQFDESVKEYNSLLKQYIDENDYLFLAKQERLRTPDWRHYYDVKHITPYAVPIFVASLKNALRAACGILQQQHDQPQRHNNRRGDRYSNNNNRGGLQNRGGVGRGNGRGRGGWGGRGRGRGQHGHGGFERGGRFNFRDEFEKFKLEIRNLITTQREG